MEHLFQFNFTDFTEFPIINSVQPVQTPPVEAEDNDYCEEIMRDGKKYHSCTFANCGKVFRFKSEFMRHKLTHVPQRPLDCPFAGCTKTFKREDALKNHLRIHTGELPFKCDINECNQSFPTKAGLRYHMLKHKGEKECKCSFPGCNKTFLTMSQLKQHESALNYHQKMTNQTKVAQPQEKAKEMIEENPQDQPSNTEKVKDIFLDEFFAPESKPAGDLEWGTKDQNDEEQSNAISEDLQSNFEKMVKVILTENNVMKKRLNMCTTLMDLMQENTDLKNRLNKTPEFEDQFSTTPQEFSDDKIFSFLNFDDQDKNTSFY